MCFVPPLATLIQYPSMLIAIWLQESQHEYFPENILFRLRVNICLTFKELITLMCDMCSAICITMMI